MKGEADFKCHLESKYVVSVCLLSMCSLASENFSYAVRYSKMRYRLGVGSSLCEGPGKMVFFERGRLTIEQVRIHGG